PSHTMIHGPRRTFEFGHELEYLCHAIEYYTRFLKTSSVLMCSVGLPSPAKDIRHGVVPFVARVLKNRTRSCDKRIFHRPILGERGGVVNRDPVQNSVGVHPPKPFDNMQVLTRS